MADIFISYKREDRRIAERLSISLEQLGFDVWWDFELLSGDQFRRVIENVIDQCSAALVLWSQLSRDSTFVVDEAGYAREQNKLCPARIDDCRLPLGFGGDHVIDLRGWDGEMDHEGLQTLLRSLEFKTGKKARLGARPRDAEVEARHAEMEAFKIAQAAQNASALGAFLRDYPNGAFANFVRSQLEELGVASPQATAVGASSAPRPSAAPAGGASMTVVTASGAPSTATSGGRKLSPLMWVGAAVVIAAVLLIARLWTWDSTPAATTNDSTKVQASTPIPASGPFELGALPANVRDAALRARAAEVRAEDVATRARHAATSARAGEAGYVAVGSNDRFYGTVDRRLGSYVWGPGSYTTNNPWRWTNYTGEFADNVFSGYAVFDVDDGSHFAGSFSHGRMNGPGVYRYANGDRYEGEYSNARRNGFGVEWTPGGAVRRQGFWVNDTLVPSPTSP